MPQCTCHVPRSFRMHARGSRPQLRVLSQHLSQRQPSGPRLLRLPAPAPAQAACCWYVLCSCLVLSCAYMQLLQCSGLGFSSKQCGV